jgi:hypothetical protein
MNTSILDIIERRKAGRRLEDQNPLAMYWPGLMATAIVLLALGYVLGRMT